MTYFKSASDKGNIAANFNVGLCYEEGIGTNKDLQKVNQSITLDSYSFAASRGHAEAGYNLGGIYLEGKIVIFILGEVTNYHFVSKSFSFNLRTISWPQIAKGASPVAM